MKIKFKKLHPNAIIPKGNYAGDAGVDLFTIEEFELEPGERKTVPLGFAIEIPENHVGLVWDKSGLSHKFGIKTFGGVIDSGYRGEMHVGIMNLSDKFFSFQTGHKIAQLLIQKVEQIEFEEVDKLSESDRNNKGFGSSGR